MVDSADGAASTPPQVRLFCLRDPRQARLVRERIRAFTGTLGIADEDAHAFLTAVSEAFANAVQHSQTSEAIEVSAWVDTENQIVARVVDRGVGFVPDAARMAVQCDLNEALKERGRGLSIIRACSDELSVNSLPGVGTAVLITRKLQCVPHERSDHPRHAMRAGTTMDGLLPENKILNTGL